MYLGNSPANVGNYQVVDDISSTFNGVLTSFALTALTLPINPAKSGQLLVSINGVLQEPDDTGAEGFKVSGSNIVFSSAPATGSTFWAVWQGQAVDIGTPSDGVVGTAQMSSAELELTGGLSLGDDVKAKFGASDDLQIYHDGTASWIRDTGTGNLALSTDGAQIWFGGSNGKTMISAVNNAEVSLWYDNAKKLSTTSTGIDVTGSVTCDGFTSTGIDDNATSTAITIDASENVGIGTGSLTLNGAGGLIIDNSGVNGAMTIDNPSSDLIEFTTGTNDSIAFTLSGSEKVRFPSTGGISFNGDTAAANALDDYEEGTWTPVNTAAGYVMTGLSGHYTKIGNIVNLIGQFTITTVGSNTSYATFSGLPFAVGEQHTVGIAREIQTRGQMYVIQLNRSITSLGINSMDGVVPGDNKVLTTDQYSFNVTYRV